MVVAVLMMYLCALPCDIRPSLFFEFPIFGRSAASVSAEVEDKGRLPSSACCVFMKVVWAARLARFDRSCGVWKTMQRGQARFAEDRFAVSSLRTQLARQDGSEKLETSTWHLQVGMLNALSGIVAESLDLGDILLGDAMVVLPMPGATVLYIYIHQQSIDASHNTPEQHDTPRVVVWSGIHISCTEGRSGNP